MPEETEQEKAASEAEEKKAADEKAQADAKAKAEADEKARAEKEAAEQPTNVTPIKEAPGYFQAFVKGEPFPFKKDAEGKLVRVPVKEVYDAQRKGKDNQPQAAKPANPAPKFVQVLYKEQRSLTLPPGDGHNGFHIVNGMNRVPKDVWEKSQALDVVKDLVKARKLQAF